MKAEEKWCLSTGKCVEDELFAFGMQCIEEHPCHSFIMDPTDANYKNYCVFNDDELNEIGSFKKKELPTMPVILRDYLNEYDLSSTSALRQKVFTQAPSDELYSHDMDWIRFIMYSFVREYECGSLKRSHSEEWYKTHVWHFIDPVFDHVWEIEVLR